MSRFLSLLAISLLLAVSAFAVISIQICSEHGIRSSFTGNTKFEHIPYRAQPKKVCEYSHPAQQNAPAHKFWLDCE